MPTLLHILFYIFSAAAVCSAIAVITARNPVRSVLSLVVTFFAMASIWMMLRAEFLSLILILVYVGAVMTLFLFVVMMLNINKESGQRGFVHHVFLGILTVLIVSGLMITMLGTPDFNLVQMPVPAAETEDYSDTQALGMILFTDYIYPFEVAGVILLAAIIAAIALAHRQPKGRKIQHPSAQIDVRPEDRVRLVKMRGES